MINKVIWTERALYDLSEAFDFIAIKSPNAAKKQIDRILQREKQIAKNPLTGTIQEFEFNTKFTYRYLVQDNYKLIYRVQENIAFIVMVFDCRRAPLKMEP